MLDTVKKRVAIYTRVSTDEQVNGNGLDIQEKALMDYISLHSGKYTFSKRNFYVDEWKSWAKVDEEDRPALHKMFQDAQNNEFDILLVWKIDRFFRKTLLLLEWVELLDHYKVGFISITQQFDTTQAFWKMTLQMLGVIAELERDLIQERTHNGIIESMKKWNWWRWRPPFWYRVDAKKKLIVHEEEAKVVQLAFKLLAEEKLTLSQLVKEINKAGIDTAAHSWSLWKKRQKDLKYQNFWSRGVLHRLIRNPIYKWILIQNKNTFDPHTNKYIEKPQSEWIEWKSPLIVTEELFDKAQKQLEINSRYSKRFQKRAYMLSTLLQDKQSWKKFVWYTSTKKTANYRLNGDKTKQSTPIIPKWISWNKIEWIVWNKIKTILLEPWLITKELDKLSKDKDEDYVRYQISALEKKKNTLVENTRYLLSMCTDMDKDDLEIMKQSIQNNRESIKNHEYDIQELQSTIMSNDMRKQQLKDLKALSLKFKDLLENDTLSYEIKSEICKILIKKITIDDNKNVEIHIYVPITWSDTDGNIVSESNLLKKSMKRKRWNMGAIGEKMHIIKKQLSGISSELLLCHKYGASCRARTYDPQVRSLVLFQLS